MYRVLLVIECGPPWVRLVCRFGFSSRHLDARVQEVHACGAARSYFARRLRCGAKYECLRAVQAPIGRPGRAASLVSYQWTLCLGMLAYFFSPGPPVGSPRWCCQACRQEAHPCTKHAFRPKCCSRSGSRECRARRTLYTTSATSCCTHGTSVTLVALG